MLLIDFPGSKGRVLSTIDKKHRRGGHGDQVEVK